ncbi:uncharacterized protein LOC141532433 isoform X2 [Cotesia typhae]|uniref:uncharacterized protein LOC141532433 isoform X2 n=1 Tax=Cotesia typhae TaxID=2053667 RepID=UPI003D693ACE
MDKKVFYRSNKQRLKIPEKIIDGFGYNCYRTCENVSYVRCYERSSKGCYACGKIKNGQLTLSVNHDHDNDPKLELYAVFQEELYNATISRPYRSPRLIYDHYSPSHYEASRIYTWAKMQPLMDIWKRRDRSHPYPPIPRDLQHYVTLLGLPQYNHLTVYPQGQLSFSTLEVPDNSFLTIFYDLNFVRSISTSTLLMDGTFRSTPKEPKVYQLFTILVLTNDKALIKRLKKDKLFEAIRTRKYDQIIIRKFMGLAFLPVIDVIRGYHWLLNAIPEDIKNRLYPFIAYFYDEWIVRTPPIMWSIINLDNRTNNFTESYNKKANFRFGTHPPIWKFTEILTNLQAITRIESASLEDGQDIIRQRQLPEEIYRESKIKKIWELYNAGTLDFIHFFAYISNVSNAFRANRYFDVEGNPDDNNYAHLPIFLEVDVMDLQ